MSRVYLQGAGLSVFVSKDAIKCQCRQYKTNCLRLSPLPLRARPRQLYKLVLGPAPILHTNFQENPLTTLGPFKCYVTPGGGGGGGVGGAGGGVGVTQRYVALQGGGCWY